VTLAALVFSLYMTSAANARARQRLRRDIESYLRRARLAATAGKSIYGEEWRPGRDEQQHRPRDQRPMAPSCCARSAAAGWRRRTSWTSHIVRGAAHSSRPSTGSAASSTPARVRPRRRGVAPRSVRAIVPRPSAIARSARQLRSSW
jgi:hypothetical protein